MATVLITSENENVRLKFPTDRRADPSPDCRFRRFVKECADFPDLQHVVGLRVRRLYIRTRWTSC